MSIRRFCRTVSLVTVCAVAGCKSRPVEPPPQPRATPTPAAPAVVPPSAPPVAVVPPAAPPAAPNAAIVAPIGENILSRLSIVPTASSAIAGAANQPASMTDGNLATAWNSRTGDLVNGWFEVVIPAGVTVQSFAMTAGFAHQAGRNDLFVGNHRIVRVRVTRDGESVGEFALNPEIRGMQAFALNGSGGTYRFSVVEVLAGSRPTWRELCVSEFAVHGVVPEGMSAAAPSGPSDDGGGQSDGATETAPETPSTQPPQPSTAEAMGTAAPETLTAGEPATAVDVYCRTAQLRGMRRRQCTEATTANGRAACFCGQMSGPTSPAVGLTGRGSLQRPTAPFTDAYVMARTNNPDAPVSCDLLIRTAGGMFPVQNIGLCGAPTVEGIAATGLPRMQVLSMRNAPNAGGVNELVVRYRGTVVDPNLETAECSTVWTVTCTVDAANVPSCVKAQAEPYRCVMSPVVAPSAE